MNFILKVSTFWPIVQWWFIFLRFRWLFFQVRLWLLLRLSPRLVLLIFDLLSIVFSCSWREIKAFLRWSSCRRIYVRFEIRFTWGNRVRNCWYWKWWGHRSSSRSIGCIFWWWEDCLEKIVNFSRWDCRWIVLFLGPFNPSCVYY